MRIDALTIAGPNLFRPAPDLDATLAQSAALGVDGVVVAPGRPPEYRLEPANDALAAAAAGKTGVARLARVDPNLGAAAVAEVRRCANELGCAGVFLHPGEEVFVIRDAVDVTRAAADHGLPVVVAAGLYAHSEPLQVLELASSVPDATIIMSTGGQINISGLSMVDAWTALRQHPNLLVMTNGEYRQDFIERLASELDPQRLLMATFSPYFQRAFEIERVRSAQLLDDARPLVEGDNASRLFGLDS